MKQYILQQIEQQKNGLVLIQVPTGTGKTYETSDSIGVLAKGKDTKRKIIYLTTLNKNLPEETIRFFFGNDMKAYEKSVLRIRANLDEVEEKIGTLAVPEQFQTPVYEKLVRDVDYYNRIKDKNISDKEYVQELKKRIAEQERLFRKQITKHMKQAFKTKEQRLRAIKGKKEYQWIGKLYPAVFTDEHQVLLMSVSKFLLKNSTIVEPSYSFLTADFIKGAIIFIDEFDATKNWIMAEIIARALNMRNDYLTTFNHISRMFDPDMLSAAMYQSAKNVSGKYMLADLLEEGKTITQTYKTWLSIKVDEKDADTKQNFLFKDGTYHSILKEGAHYIRAEEDTTENRIKLHFEDKKTFYAKRKDSDIVVYSMLRDIDRFFRHFHLFLYKWANEYCTMINAERVKQDRDMLELDNALDSILEVLELNPSQKELMKGGLCDSSISDILWDKAMDNSFYECGFEIFSFVDDDRHNDFTKLDYIKIFESPEKILGYLAERSLVFGISATAQIPTVVGNYNLNYLRETLGSRYIPMDKGLEKRIQAELEKKWKKYEDGQIQIHTQVMSAVNGVFLLEDVCREIFDKAEYGDIAAGMIQQMNVSEYYQMRYCNILRSMHFFAAEKSLQSMLYMGMALPKEQDAQMNERLLRGLGRLVLKDVGNEAVPQCMDDFIVILRSDDFDEQKEKLMKRLAQGEKIYIMSTYQTIGAGQNLQYEISALPADMQDALVELIPPSEDGDSRNITKDIDALYLGEITHLTVNTYGESAIEESELLEMLFQIEELYSAGEINFREMESAIKIAFTARKGDRQMNRLQNYRSIRMQANQMVLQAVGRICRTHMKARDIYILIDQKLLDKLDAGELESRILPPEMKAIKDLCKQLGKVYTSDEKQILNLAERVSSHSNWWIHQILSRGWNARSMQMWQQMRETVLKYPTASAEQSELDELIRKHYITAGEEINEYLYSQFTDFTDVVIDFGTDVIAFEHSDRAKKKGESDDYIISKVSSVDAKLDQMLKYPGMKEYFIQKGYATSFEKAAYIMSPVLFHNIYKGALGEVAGAYILKAERGIELRDIVDPTKFEFFDFELAQDVYVDFKNWKMTYAQDRQKTLREISRKLDAIGGKRVYIINVTADKDYVPSITADKRIIEIPALIDEEGKVVVGALDQIRKEDYER